VVHDAPAYHDHNWGSWRGVSWEWGAGHGISHALLYGGVIAETDAAHGVPFFLALTDSFGVEQVYRFGAVGQSGRIATRGVSGVTAPESLSIVAARAGDTLRIAIAILDAAASSSATAGPGRALLQMRGRWRAIGTAAGIPVADSGSGFFETWLSGVRFPGPTAQPVP
jgi:hypothetical protein